MTNARKPAPRSKPMSKKDLKKTKGGKVPTTGGPIPIPYPNEGGGKKEG